MPIQDILSSIDQEISKLQRARTLLAGLNDVEALVKQRGRPKGISVKLKAPSAPVKKRAAKRTMSSEGKARIAAAQKARWTKPKTKAAVTHKITSAPSSTPADQSTSRANKASAKKIPTAKKTSNAKKQSIPAKSTSDVQVTGSSDPRISPDGSL
jgi:hypothetical protein